MPAISDFVAQPLTGKQIQVKADPLLGLDAGSLDETAAELQLEINENAEAADVCLLLFENALL